MVDVKKEDCVVMVTGGSGFLGQHVIKLLSTHADHMTAIRVVDLVPFENKLDYTPTKPIRSYVGSINDEDLMREATKECHCVIHLAAITDHSMFPNREKLEKVNIEGTAVTLNAAQESPSVKRFIGCGSYSVLNNSTNIVNGNEDTPIPPKWLFQDYTSTKYASERMVLEANNKEFPTVVLRPATMYGELDDISVTALLRLARQSGGTVYQVNCGENTHQYAYVGNVAWAFVCAEKKLYNEQKTLNKSDKQQNGNENENVLHNSEGQVYVGSENLTAIAGQAYFVSDDTPIENIFHFTEFFITACGYRMSRLKIPYYLVLTQLYIIYLILYVLSLFGLKLNMDYSIPATRFLNSSLSVTYERAKKQLGYVPLFTFQDSKEKSVSFYKEIVEKWKTG